MNAALLVFAKAPVAGQAKTRLAPALGLDGAARLQGALIEDALTRARDARPPVLQLWGAGADPDGALAAAAQRHGASLHAQCDGDLGRRMAAALAHASAAGRPAIVIGSDAPGLSPAQIKEADHQLGYNDAVIVPAHDGGYVLLGLHRCDASLFTGVEWGSERVLAQTRERLRALGWRHAELAPTWDVDRPEDLERLAALGEEWSKPLSGA